MSNLDPAELARFERLADRWWDRDGEFRPLHDLNAGRLAYLRERVVLAGRRVLDVGCGGGLLAEALAGDGAEVTGIDASTGALAAARAHAAAGGLRIAYEQATAEAWAEQHAHGYDLITCMELIEHVPDPPALVGACARLVRPGGDLVFSTINRSVRAYLLAVLGAEYVLGLLPRGTHDFARFVRPSELAGWLRARGCSVADLRGLVYNPFSRACKPTAEVAVNYLLHARAGDP